MSERTMSQPEKGEAPVPAPADAGSQLFSRQRSAGREVGPSSAADEAFDISGSDSDNASAEPRSGHNFGSLHVRASTPETIEPKLAVNRPDDESEREADRLAEEVMRAPDRSAAGRAVAQAPVQPISLKSLPAEHAGAVRPQTAQNEDGEGEYAREEVREDGSARIGQSTSRTPRFTPQPGAQFEGGTGIGQPLPAPVRSVFETRFGHDFARVRVHTGPPAAQAARALRAEAFTRSQDIFFGEGRYQPDTFAGRKLLAHELVHTIQQRPSVPNDPGMIQRRVTPISAPEANVEVTPTSLAPSVDTPGESAAGPPPETREAPRTEGLVEEGVTPGRVERDSGGDRPAPVATTPPAPVAEAGVSAEGASTSSPAGLVEEAGGAEQRQEPTIDVSSSGALLRSLGTVPPSSFGQAMTSPKAPPPRFRRRSVPPWRPACPRSRARPVCRAFPSDRRRSRRCSSRARPPPWRARTAARANHPRPATRSRAALPLATRSPPPSASRRKKKGGWTGCSARCAAF